MNFIETKNFEKKSNSLYHLIQTKLTINKNTMKIFTKLKKTNNNNGPAYLRLISLKSAESKFNLI